MNYRITDLQGESRDCTHVPAAMRKEPIYRMMFVFAVIAIIYPRIQGWSYIFSEKGIYVPIIVKGRSTNTNGPRILIRSLAVPTTTSEIFELWSTW